MKSFGLVSFVVFCFCISIFGCTDTNEEPTTLAGPTFLFSVEPTTAFSGPFPNDLLLDPATGKMKPNLLTTDERVIGFSNETARSLMESRMIERNGFGNNTAVFFPIDEEVDLDSAVGRVHMVSLSGPDAGRRLEVRTFWSPYARALGVFPHWSEYGVAGSKYLVWVESGVTTVNGEAIVAHPEVTRALNGESDNPIVNMAFANARSAIESHGAGTVVMATVYTTEDPFDYLQGLLTDLDGYALKPLESTTSWNEETEAFVEGGPISGEDLQRYFGTPSEPFSAAPGVWTTGNRAAAADLPDRPSPYTGGSFHQGIGMVINGSFKVPAPNYVSENGILENIAFRSDDDGLVWTLEEMVPFTLVLCENHLEAPENLPVSLYSHGGNRRRGDLMSYATVNCLNNVATFSSESPFHAGRGFPVLLEDLKLVAAGGSDTENHFNATQIGDSNFVPDHISDGAGPVQSVGNLLGISYNFDPAIAEGNTLGYIMNAYIALRHLTENDWTSFHPGLSFDPERIFQQAESFGASLTIGLSAVTERFKAVIWTSGTVGLMSPAALTAPDYGPLAGSIIQPMLGLQSTVDEIQAQSNQDPMLSIWQWLIQRSDASPWAPMVLRHRRGPGAVPVLYGTSSWDSTLASTPQFMLTNALGAPSFRLDGWTLDPMIPDVPDEWGESFPDMPVSNNISIDDRNVTAGAFHWSDSSHVFATRPVSYLEYEKMYPPLVEHDTPQPFRTPICEWQHSVAHFMRTTLAGETELIAPGGDCETLYRQ